MYNRTLLDPFDQQSRAETQSQVFFHQRQAFVSGSQFSALGYDLADLVQIDGSDIAKSVNIFDELPDDLGLSF